MRVLVIGAGVIGLTTAIAVARRGATVEIWARQFTPYTTSDVAAAFWYPYAAYPIERVMDWAIASFRAFKDEEGAARSGVRRRTVTKLFRAGFETPSWASMTQDYREFASKEMPSGFSGAYAFTTFVIDMTMYMPYLMQVCNEIGIAFQQKDITDLVDLADAAASFDVIVNCTGLGARELVNDTELTGVKGQVVKVRPLAAMPEQVTLDESVHERFTMIVPRASDIVLGGTYEEKFDDLCVDDDEVKRIIESCQAVAPELRQIDIAGTNCGLRPVRSTVRLEKQELDDGRQIIHNYGHGGAGVTLSWGCAAEVVDMMRQFSSVSL